MGAGEQAARFFRRRPFPDLLLAGVANRGCRSMFESIAAWFVVSLFCLGIWIIAGAVWQQ
jgi:hypothetical protein